MLTIIVHNKFGQRVLLSQATTLVDDDEEWPYLETFDEIANAFNALHVLSDEQVTERANNADEAQRKREARDRILAAHGFLAAHANAPLFTSTEIVEPAAAAHDNAPLFTSTEEVARRAGIEAHRNDPTYHSEFAEPMPTRPAQPPYRTFLGRFFYGGK